MSKFYYMRDNHTFRGLSDDLEMALSQIEEELDAGWTSGMLCSKHAIEFDSVHADYRWGKEETLGRFRKALSAHLTQEHS